MIPLRIVLLSAFLATSPNAIAENGGPTGGRTIEMRVDGLVCAFCAQGVSKKLAAQPSIEDVFVDLERGLVAVALRTGLDINDETLRETLTAAGYSLRQVERRTESLTELRARLEASRK